jgi:tRNA nucleotidyltransferase (CCA-adding enzyme)
MAIELNNSNFGQLLDFFEGLKDIESKKVRILHNLSFVEDPTRILRAIRFEQRYGFKLDDITEKLLKKAIEEDLISKVSQFRVKEEMINIFSEQDPSLAIGRFLEFGLIERLFQNVKPSKNIINYYKKAVKLIKIATSNLYSVYRPAVFLPILLYDLDIPELDDIEARYGFSKPLKRVFKELVMEKDLFEDKLSIDPIKKSDIWEVFHKLSVETAIVLVTMQNSEKIDEYFKLYISEISKIKLEYINGKVLESLGYKKGRKLGRVLKSILKDKIDGKIDNELTYISTKLVPFTEEDPFERTRRRLKENSLFKGNNRTS